MDKITQADYRHIFPINNKEFEPYPLIASAYAGRAYNAEIKSVYGTEKLLSAIHLLRRAAPDYYKTYIGDIIEYYEMGFQISYINYKEDVVTPALELFDKQQVLEVVFKKAMKGHGGYQWEYNKAFLMEKDDGTPWGLRESIQRQSYNIGLSEGYIFRSWLEIAYLPSAYEHLFIEYTQKITEGILKARSEKRGTIQEKHPISTPLVEGKPVPGMGEDRVYPIDILISSSEGKKMIPTLISLYGDKGAKQLVYMLYALQVMGHIDKNTLRQNTGLTRTVIIEAITKTFLTVPIPDASKKAKFEAYRKQLNRLEDTWTTQNEQAVILQYRSDILDALGRKK